MEEPIRKSLTKWLLVIGLTFNLADYGCVYNGGASFVGSGFAISVDSNKWYQETGYPNNVYNIHNGGTFKFRSSAGTEVTNYMRCQ